MFFVSFFDQLNNENELNSIPILILLKVFITIRIFYRYYIKEQIKSMRAIFLVLIFTVTSCTFTQKIKDGEMAYDRKQFAVAINMLSDEFDRIDYPEIKARKAYLIAESYNEINNIPSAIEWYKNAFDLNFGDKALEKLGYALKKNEQYNEAVRVFRAVQERNGNTAAVSREISECILAIEWNEQVGKSPISVQKIDQNSPYSDYAPTIFEGNQLVFTSDRNNAKNEGIYNWTGHWFSDLYIVNPYSKEAVPFDSNINSTNNDGTACFNSDFSEIFFTRCKSEIDDDYCKLMHSKRTNNGWSEPDYLNFVQERVNYGHPSLHSNDSILFFAAQLESGFGGYDLYYSTKNEKGWDEPLLLGNKVNSIGNEKFPFIYEDTLYFSSDGWPGMGGLDIFKVYLTEDGSWSDIENLKPPINSGADDFCYIVDINKRKTTGEFAGYFSSSRKGSDEDDIYAFKSSIIDVPIEEVVTVEKDKGELKLYLAIKSYENKYLVDDDPLSGVVGKQNLPSVEIEVESKSGISKITSGNKAFIVIDIEAGQTYTVRASKNGYLTEIKNFVPKDVPLNGEKTYNLDLLLEKIYTDREIILENIYYDYNESFIRNDAKPSLNNLGSMLNNNPNVKIQLFSHTDCRGKDDFNMTLSQARAQAAVNYLVSIGINKDRMIAIGLGESRPAINCYCETCSEDEHQENRRTSFKIMEH